MIVCLCHRVSDRDISRAVREGTDCFDVLQDETRVASSCGCCYDCARAVFDQSCAEQAARTQAGAQPVTVHRRAAAADPALSAQDVRSA